MKINTCFYQYYPYKAEILIPYLTETEKEIEVSFHGCFNRNHLEDLIEIDNRGPYVKVIISRNSIYHLLPEALFFDPDTLVNAKNRDEVNFRIDQLQKQKNIIQNVFKPFDNELFSLNMTLEKKISEMLLNQSNLWLSTYNILQSSTNSFIQKIIPILPFATQIRGDFMLLRRILNVVFSAEVNFIFDYKEYGKLKIPLLKIKIHKKNLTNAEYCKENQEAMDFFLLFYEWFLPYEMNYEYRIQNTETLFILSKNLTLNYNTQLKYSK